MSRLIILAGWSYLCSFAFDVIEYRYSFCMKGGNVGKELCTGRWISFTISNRAFLLVQSVIVISEEIKALVVWDRLGEIFNKKEEKLTGSSESQFKIAKASHEESSVYVKTTVMTLTLLTILLDVANISTIVYFSNMPQKILANVVAIVGWLLTYKTWFCNKSFFPWCPGAPGQNLLIAV